MDVVQFTSPPNPNTHFLNSIEPETPNEDGTEALEVKDRVRTIFDKAAHIFKSLDPPKITETDGIYSELYQLYGNVHSENRQLRKTVRDLKGGPEEDASMDSSQSDSSATLRGAHGGQQYPPPVRAIYRLYKRTVRENYKLQKYVLSRSNFGQ